MPALLSKIEMTNALFNRLKGYSTDLKLINSVLMTMDLPLLSCNHEEMAKAIFNGTVVRAFERSAKGFSGDLEDRIYDLILDLTRRDDEDAWKIAHAHPYTFVYGEFVENSYTKTMRKAYDFDTLYSGE